MKPRIIPVNKTTLPPMQEYISKIALCWENCFLTNNGPLVQELESKLADVLEAEFFLTTNNGTSALQLAIQALDLKGEILTTPFTYVATTSSILWEHCTPRFVDIDKNSLCIDVEKIEEKITSKTTAILAVHVYGNPCDVDKIQEIAEKHRLKVIYDAAHAFGVRLKGKSITSFGDISTLSFHATKLFQSIEGGALIIADKNVAAKVDLQRAFGHRQDEHFILGINAKMNEFQAAMGLCNIPLVQKFIQRRKAISELYDRETDQLAEVETLRFNHQVERNYSYYPIFFRNEATCLAIQNSLSEFGIMTRRYFYPSLNTLSYVNYEPCPVSEDISRRVLCLPLYSDLTLDDAHFVNQKLKESLSRLCEKTSSYLAPEI